MVTGAGHPGLLCLPGGQVPTFSPEPHFPIGVFGTTTYVGQPFPVQRGDRLLFVSDGTLEAVKARGEQFGEPPWDPWRPHTLEDARATALAGVYCGFVAFLLL